MSQMVIDELLIGDSKPMRELKRLIAQLGPTELPILIEGETGTGKELVARALHAVSGRRGRLVAVNVCAIPETMFESALFGHVRGAFTGATHDAPGYLAEANGGTLFLDEIGSLPRVLQTKLLRVIETGEYRPVGGRSDLQSAFRVVAATNERLDGLVHSGAFRSDLAFRLAIGRLRAPALRERLDDIPMLVQHFVHAAGNGRAFDAAALSELSSRYWAGNVRELRSAVLHALVTCPSATIGVEHLGIENGNRCAATSRRGQLLEQLEAARWDIDALAASTGTHRSTVYRQMRREGITVDRAKRAASARS